MPAVAAQPAGEGKPHLFGSTYELQNYFNFSGELTLR